MRQFFNSATIFGSISNIDYKRFLSYINSNLITLFKKNKTNLLSIDIGSSSIKIIEVGKKNDQIILENYAIIPLPEGSIANHKIESYSMLSDSIRDFVTKNNYIDRDAAVILAGPQVITQVIKIPSGLADHQLVTHVEIEAEKYLPFSTEEIAMDFDILDNRGTNSKYTEVILVATKKSYVDEYIKVLAASDLDLRVIDVYGCAVARLVMHVAAKQLKKDLENKVVMCIDIGHEILTVSVFKNERVLFNKEQNFGSNIINQQIQQEHDVDLAVSEQLKRKYNDPQISNIINSFNNQTAMQLYHLLQFFYSSVNSEQIDEAILIGGSAALPNIADVIQEKIKLPVTILDPFIDINTEKFVNNSDFEQEKSSLALVCGLGLRSYVE